jgi:hypothetical protein
VRYVLVFLAALAWLSWLQPWGAFGDPDSFYHAKMAALIAVQGPVMEFPWLDLTTLGSAFVNQNFFYHLVLIPFISLFGMFTGTQIATVVFGALFAVAAYAVGRAYRVPLPWLWSLLLLAMPIMGTRLTWAKSGSLVQVLFVFGLMSVVTRKAWLACLVSILYALTHGGWLVLLVCQALYVLGELATAHWGFGDRINKDFRNLWPALASSWVGIAIGSLLHPNREALWHFFVTQVISVGLVNPLGQVPLGGEWLAPGLADHFTFWFLPGVALLLVAFGWMAARSVLDRLAAKQAVGYLFAFAFPFAWSLRSVRFQEYAAPVLIICLALLAKQVDAKTWLQKWQELFPRWVSGLALGAVAVVAALQTGEMRGMIHRHAKTFDRLEPAMRVVREIAEPGERVAHSSWDIFPELFALDGRYRYVSGLDPTFLLDEHPEISKTYTDLFFGKATSGAYDLIQNVLRARVVVVDRRDHAFESALLLDRRFEVVYYDEQAVVFKTQ